MNVISIILSLVSLVVPITQAKRKYQNQAHTFLAKYATVYPQDNPLRLLPLCQIALIYGERVYFYSREIYREWGELSKEVQTAILKEVGKPPLNIPSFLRGEDLFRKCYDILQTAYLNMYEDKNGFNRWFYGCAKYLTSAIKEHGNEPFSLYALTLPTKENIYHGEITRFDETFGHDKSEPFATILDDYFDNSNMPLLELANQNLSIHSNLRNPHYILNVTYAIIRHCMKDYETCGIENIETCEDAFLDIMLSSLTSYKENSYFF